MGGCGLAGIIVIGGIGSYIIYPILSLIFLGDMSFSPGDGAGFWPNALNVISFIPGIILGLFITGL